MSGWLSMDCKKGWVSVIIPTYNRAALLDEALKSVVAQTYRPIECIVVDDGSTDSTEDVLRRYSDFQSLDFTLIVIKQENGGAQKARNNGTAISKGEFIQYLDSDDLLYSKKILRQVTYLQNNQDCDCVFGDWENGSVEDKKLIKAYRSNDFVKQIITLERPIHTLAFLIRRSLVQKAGCWDVSLKRMQEIDFQLNTLVHGGKFDYEPLLCGLWRHHSDERIHNQTTVRDMLPFFQKWENVLGKQKMFNSEMGKRIAEWYMWFISQSKRQPVSILVPVLEEVVRLQPSIPFYGTRKMKLLRLLLGRKGSLYIWMIRYRNT
jgi:glycosyltransferase involved in cell wall biosynthesis